MASWAGAAEERTPKPALARDQRGGDRPHDLWCGVDRLVDRATRDTDLAFHGLHLFAARRYRETGRLVPRSVRDAERLAAITTLVAPVVLQQARNAYDRTMVLMKGPEIAVRYPDPALRPFGDLDLLVPDAAEAQRALIAAGFVPAGSPARYVGIHHLQPLRWPGSPLFVELHDRPKWIDGLPAPSRAELLASALPGSTGVAGVLALTPDLHALVIAAHSWAHSPLARLLHLVDVAAVTQGLDRSALRRRAAQLGLKSVWDTTIAAVDCVLGEAETPWALRLWARNLAAVRERTVLESHLGRWLPPWWALDARAALGANAFTASRELGPHGGEPWRRKLRRTAYAFRDATRRLSDHQRALGEEGP